MNNRGRFVGCDKDAICGQKPIPSLVEVLGSQILNNWFDVTGGNQLTDSTCVYWAAVKSGRLWESLDSWGAPPGLPSIQTIPGHWCHTCALCVGTTSRFILHATCCIMSDCKCGV